MSDDSIRTLNWNLNPVVLEIHGALQPAPPPILTTIVQ